MQNEVQEPPPLFSATINCELTHNQGRVPPVAAWLIDVGDINRTAINHRAVAYCQENTPQPWNRRLPLVRFFSRVHARDALYDYICLLDANMNSFLGALYVEMLCLASPS
jgi:hypothetical protein